MIGDMAVKTLQFLKVAWMLWWRFVILGFITGLIGNDMGIGSFVLAAISSALIVFVFNRTIRIFPLFNAIILQVNPFPRLSPKPQIPSQFPYNQFNPYNPNQPQGPQKHSLPFHQNQFPQHPQTGPASPHPQTGGQPLKRATHKGRMTGFEPKSLSHLPEPYGPSMFGSPGSGLSSSGFSQKNISLGVEGEMNFAKALSLTGMLDKYISVWSVPVPDKKLFQPSKFSTDIDCIIATGSIVYLIDLKFYTGGDVTYTSYGDQLFIIDRPTGQLIKSVRMTKNMEMATDAFRSHFPNVPVQPVVLFVPTNSGEGVVNNVMWPGGIPAMNMTDFMDVLKTQPPSVQNSPATYSALRMSTLR